MYWVLFRAHGTSTRFETDDRVGAVVALVGTVLDAHAQLIDYSGNLDGALDTVLAGVTLTDDVTETAA